MTNCEVVINEKFEIQIDSCYDSIESIIGLIVKNSESEINENNKLSIYNTDGTIYSELKIDKDKYIIAFKCLDFNNEFYFIILDGDKKLIKRNDERLIFLSWEDHILKNVFSVNFDDKVMPFRQSIGGEDLKLKLSNNRRIIPIAIDGFYMKVKYQDFSTDVSIIGWIQWRNDMCLLVQFLYFA